MIQAFFYVSLLTLIAKITAPALSADALKGIDQVNARASVQTGITAAVVDVLVAVCAGVARIADASAAAAATPAATRRAFAAAAKLFRHTELRVMRSGFGAVLALPLYRTVTVIVGLRVEAGRRITTGIRTAVIAIDLALVAGEAYGTYALVLVHQIATFAAVLARLRRALIDVDVAVFAGIAGGATAMIVVH